MAPQVITTRGGASLTVPLGSFLLPNGTVAIGTAQVRVRELYSVADMALSGMAAVRGNGLVVAPTLTAVSEADAVRLIRQL